MEHAAPYTTDIADDQLDIVAEIHREVDKYARELSQAKRVKVVINFAGTSLKVCLEHLEY